MRFDPKPGETVELPVATASGAPGGSLAKYRFEPLPIQPSLVWCMGGGKADIYKLIRLDDQSSWALKVFKRRFQPEAIAQSRSDHPHLRFFSSLPGFPTLFAMFRTAIVPEVPAVSTYAELGGSILMRWVEGKILDDWFVQAKKTRIPWDRIIAASRAFLATMVQLERLGVAHTDISCGNVTVLSRGGAMEIQLIDLEDLWHAQASPSSRSLGTPGYGHPELANLSSSAAGDRYATAMLLFEMLLVGNPGLIADFAGGGYLRGDRRDAAAAARFERGRAWIQTISPGLAAAFQQAWASPTLEDCPRIEDLANLLASPAMNVVPGSTRQVVRARRCLQCRALNEERRSTCVRCGAELRVRVS